MTVERFWAMMELMLPLVARHLSLRCFSVVSMLTCLRHNWGHFNPTLPGVVDQDPLMAQRMHTLGIVAEALSREGASSLDHLAPLVDPFHDH